MSNEWSFTSADIDGARERLSDASQRLRSALHDAGARMTHGASAGADHTRAIGKDLFETGQRATRTARSAVEERPLEAVLIVGLAAFALGWVLRRLQESTDRRAAATTRPRRAPARSRRRAT
jgi:hypothetical protein